MFYSQYCTFLFPPKGDNLEEREILRTGFYHRFYKFDTAGAMGIKVWFCHGHQGMAFGHKR